MNLSADLYAIIHRIRVL